MNSSVAVLERPARGSQEPRFLSLPPGKPDRPGDFADRAVQLARFAGLNLDPWQELTLRSMLRTAPNSDQWAAYESLILVPRQNGKSVILEAFDLAKLFLSPPGHMIMHTAHLFPTAMESFRHLSGLIKNTPELNAEVARWSNAHGSEGIELKNGSRLRFAARGVNGAGRGFSPDDVVFDEAYRLPPEAEEALLYAISAKPNPQLVYASSTGFPDSEILWALVQRGRAGDDPSLMMAEWSADPDLDLADEDQMWLAVAQANPALGYRLTAEKTGAEYRKSASQDRLEGFGRERLGLWAEALADSGPITPAAWIDQEDPDSAPESPTGVCFAVAVAQDRSWSCIASSGRRADGADHVEIVANQRGTAWVADWFTDPERNRLDEYQPCAIVINPAGPEGSLIAEFTERGVDVVQPSARELGQAFGMFYDGVMVEKTLRHRPDALLARALEAARDRQLSDAKTWDQRGSTDISPIVAATNALWGFATHGADRAPNIW